MLVLVLKLPVVRRMKYTHVRYKCIAPALFNSNDLHVSLVHQTTTIYDYMSYSLLSI